MESADIPPEGATKCWQSGISSLMKPNRSPDTLIRSDLIPKISAAAKAEHREPRELVSEAVERYLAERRWFRPDEVHEKIARGLESLAQGKGLEGESVIAELLAELDAPRRTR